MIDSKEARKEVWDQLSTHERTICDRHDRITAAEYALYEAQKQLQDLCEHPAHATQIERGSNTGNYDPHADCYWTNYKCCLCDKYWTVYH